jgi:hypothetical protein
MDGKSLPIAVSIVVSASLRLAENLDRLLIIHSKFSVAPVPSEVPKLLTDTCEQMFRVIALVWRPPRIAAYYANLRDFTPSNECCALLHVSLRSGAV